MDTDDWNNYRINQFMITNNVEIIKMFSCKKRYRLDEAIKAFLSMRIIKIEENEIKYIKKIETKKLMQQTKWSFEKLKLMELDGKITSQKYNGCKYFILEDIENLMKEKKECDINEDKLREVKERLFNIGFSEKELKSILKGIRKKHMKVTNQVVLEELVKSGYLQKEINEEYKRNKLLIRAEVIQYLGIDKTEFKKIIEQGKLTWFEKLTKNRVFLLKEVEKVKKEMSEENNKYYSFNQFRNELNKITIQEIFYKYKIKYWNRNQIKNILLQGNVPHIYSEYLNFNKRKTINLLVDKKILKYGEKKIVENILVDKDYIYEKMCVHSRSFLQNFNKYAKRNKIIILNKNYYEKKFIDNIFVENFNIKEYLDIDLGYKIYKKYCRSESIKNKYEIIQYIEFKIRNNIIFINKKDLYKFIKSFIRKDRRNLEVLWKKLNEKEELKIISQNSEESKSKKAYLKKEEIQKEKEELKIISQNSEESKSKKAYLKKEEIQKEKEELKIISQDSEESKSKKVNLKKEEIPVKIKQYTTIKVKKVNYIDSSKYYELQYVIKEMKILENEIWKLYLLNNKKYVFYETKIYIEKDYIDEILKTGINKYLIEKTISLEEIKIKFCINKNKIKKIVSQLNKKTDLIDGRVIVEKIKENKFLNDILSKKIIELKNIKNMLKLSDERLNCLIKKSGVNPKIILRKKYITQEEFLKIKKIYVDNTITILEFCKLSSFSIEFIQEICRKNSLGFMLSDYEYTLLDIRNYYKLNKFLRDLGEEVRIDVMKKNKNYENEVSKLEIMGIKNIIVCKMKSIFLKNSLKKEIIQKEIEIYIKLKKISKKKFLKPDTHRNLKLNKKIYSDPILMYLYRKNNGIIFNWKEKKSLIYVMKFLRELSKYILNINSDDFKVKSVKRIFIKDKCVKKVVGVGGIIEETQKYLIPIDTALCIVKKWSCDKENTFYNINNISERRKGYSFNDIVNICKKYKIKIIDKNQKILINGEEYAKFKKITKGIECQFTILKKYKISSDFIFRHIKKKEIEVFFRGNRLYIKEKDVEKLIKRKISDGKMTIREKIDREILNLNLSEYEKQIVEEFFIIAVNRCSNDKKKLFKINRIAKAIKFLKEENIFLDKINKLNLNKVLKWNDISSSMLKEISIFLNYLEAKKLSDTKISIKKKRREKGEVYTKEVWNAYYKYIFNVEYHIEKAISERMYACAWLKSIFNVTNFIRSKEIYRMPNIDIEIIKESIDDIKSNLVLSNRSAKLLEENLYYKIREMKISKNEEQIIILIPEELRNIFMTIYYIVEMHRKQQKLDSIFAPFTAERPIKSKFMNEFFVDFGYGDNIQTLKANRSFATYGYEFIVENKINSLGSIYVMRLARGHKHLDTTAIYIKNSFIDISKELFESEHFGWMYEVIVDTICEKNFEKKKETIKIFNEKIKPKEMECIAKYQLKKEKEKELIVERLLKLSPSEMRAVIEGLNSGKYKSKERGISCMRKNEKNCNLKGSCILCNLAIFKKEIFFSIENYINSIISKLNYCEEWEIMKRKKYSIMLYRCMDILNYGAKKYGIELMSDYIDIIKLKEKLKNVKNVLLEEL